MNVSWDFNESNLGGIRRVSMHPDFGVDNEFMPVPTAVQSLKPKSKTPCKFYMAGKCSFGSRCQFSHIITEHSNTAADLCSFYRAGHCKYGSSCALRHDSYEEVQREDEVNFLTNSMDKLDFDFNEIPILESSMKRSEGRNSLLPSFLVDELLLDDDDHHEEHHAHSNHQIQSSSTNLSGNSDEFQFYERSASVPLTQISPFDYHNSRFNANPASYGEAISNGINLQPQLNAESFFISPATESKAFEARSGPADELCAFSIMGKCRYGSFCRNVHGLQCPRCLLHVLHPTDMARNEEHLNECLSKPESVPIAQIHQIPCGLCHLPVLQGVDPRFGLLNCSHAFCLACIRSWRATHFDANNENSRSCPECREVTYFIVPSSTWIEDQEEKIKIIEQYKKRMSAIPCKYHDFGRGDCPFGSSCFYEHRIDSSEKFPPRAPLILDHREQIAKVRDAKLSDYIVFKTAPARNKKK